MLYNFQNRKEVEGMLRLITTMTFFISLTYAQTSKIV